MAELRIRRAVVVVCLVLLSACSKTDPNRKPVTPVRGTVLVDGQGVKDVSIILHDLKGIDKNQPTKSSTITGEGGKFAFSTYEEGDGVPEGEYQMTFTWGKFNPLAMQYEGDEFKGKYNDPTKSEHKVKVEKGKPIDLGIVDLKTR